jgi:hypothetical protein
MGKGSNAACGDQALVDGFSSPVGGGPGSGLEPLPGPVGGLPRAVGTAGRAVMAAALGAWARGGSARAVTRRPPGWSRRPGTSWRGPTEVLGPPEEPEAMELVEGLPRRPEMDPDAWPAGGVSSASCASAGGSRSEGSAGVTRGLTPASSATQRIVTRRGRGRNEAHLRPATTRRSTETGHATAGRCYTSPLPGVHAFSRMSPRRPARSARAGTGERGAGGVPERG